MRIAEDGVLRIGFVSRIANSAPVTDREPVAAMQLFTIVASRAT